MILDTQCLPDLTPEEKAAYKSIVQAAMDDAAPDQKKVKDQYIEDEAPKLLDQAKAAGDSLSLEDAQKTVWARVEGGKHRDLYRGEFIIFDKFGPVPVNEIWKNPDKYHKAGASDPQEPELGRGKAKLYVNQKDGTIVLHSFAHGGIKYFLHDVPVGTEINKRSDSNKDQWSVKYVLAWVESTDDRRAILKEWVKKLRGMDSNEQEEIKLAVQEKTQAKISILNKRLRDQQVAWAKQDRKKAQTEKSQARKANGITEILYQVNGTGDCCHAASKALRDSKEGLIYRYSGSLIKIVNKPPTNVRMVKSKADLSAEYPPMPLISPLNLETVCHEVEKFAILQRVVSEKDDIREDIPWTRQILKGTLALTEYHEPNLIGIVEHPYVDDNFQPVTDPGYDPNTGLYKCFNGNIGTHSQNADQALVWLTEEWAAEFPFASELDRFAAVAALLTGMQRRLIVDGSGCPGFLFTAPERSSGKTTLAQLISRSLYGRPMAAASYADDDAEMSKTLIGLFIEGQPAVMFDNLQEGAVIESNEIAKAITSDSYSGRWLGQNKIVTLPTSTLWLFSGNNISVCGDFNSRIIPIELDPRTANPDQRRFERSDIAAWAEQNREKTLSACMKVIRAGQNFDNASATPSRFPTWDKFIRFPILKIAGVDVAETFQKNKMSDPKLEGQRAFFETWHEVFGSELITVRDFLKAAQQSTTEYGRTEYEEILKEALEDIFPGGLPTSKALGKWLGSVKNRFFGDYRLESAGKITAREQKGSALYRVRQNVGL